MSTALLDPLRLPLHGSSLIEASAGTGKTFTIAALYLRLVLGHGGPAAFATPLTPPEILVVTFTEAATKELRDRIRARLGEAAEAFLLPPSDEQAASALDPLLRALRDSYPSADWPACAQRLQLAAEWMDEAAVSTIHGWCNRMLREHAFDSGSLFDQQLEADQTEIEQEAVRDYWRTFFYPLPAEDAQCVAGWWKDPDALRYAVRKLLAEVDALGEAPPEPAVALREARLARAEELAAMRAPWTSWCEELQQLLDDAVAAGQVNGTRLKKAHYDGWLQQLRDWCSGAQDAPVLSEAARKRLTRAGLREAWKKPDEAPDHPALQDLETLAERLGCLPECREQVLVHAARWVAARIASEQHRRAEMGFDDLLTQLHAALQRPDSGTRLAALIRQQFPVALIDEFQDTDPVQYGIFRAIYRPEEPQQDTALILIGDPKQAIYAFRGADIYTYLKAKRDTAGRHATLGTNFRSTKAMVDAVNRVFLQAEQRAGEGAFLFRDARENPLPFVAVEAKGRREHWQVQGSEPPALTCWWHDEGTAVKPGDYRRRMASACASEVVRLLNLAQAGQAGFAKGTEWQPLRPRDIAVLVNDGTEAREVRAALGERGVRSVYLSDRGNVFCSEAAAELQHLLQACAAPEDGALVRAALATALLAQDWHALDRLNHDEIHWEERLEQFRGYRNCWQRQGVLPMLRRLLHDFEVPQRLVAAREGERLLTDLLHLAELLQQASVLLDGEHALLRYLAEQREEGSAAMDNRQLRLESDADLLKVVTVHKSKGLEYPLVFLPFPCACRPVKPDDLPIHWHDDEGRLRVSLHADDTILARAEHERLGEDLRKLYVALTRARFATWVGIAPTMDFERSAIGYLLMGGESVAPGQLAPVLEETLGADPAIAIVRAPEASQEEHVARRAVAALAPAPPLPASAPERWWIASYSRLRKASGTRPARAPESAEEETYLEAVDEAPREPVAAAMSLLGSLHEFPRGPTPGSFLHGLLEWAGRKGFAAAAEPGEIDEILARRCRPERWAPQRDALRDWLTRWLATPLDLRRLAPKAKPVAPRALTAIQPEMEFWLAASGVEAQALDELVCRYTLDGVPRPRLEPQHLNGMLKGFIDLVFEHEGRYYVADYKSNWLGPDDASYTVQAMRDEVLHARYELQYCLYLFALHRLLRSRLPDYDYDRHIGGAVYVFLRGHAAATQGLHLERPPAALMDALDRMFAAEVSA